MISNRDSGTVETRAAPAWRSALRSAASLARTTHRDSLATGLLLAGILCVFFGRALFTDSILAPADNLFATPFFAASAPPGFTHPSNILLFDQTYQFVPWRHFAWQSLREGQWPLWNPYSFAGTPFMATMQSAVFYPINLLLTWLPFERTFVWSAVLRLWIAGVGTYFLARRYRLGLASALIAAISFMLSGFLVTLLGHPHVNVAVWLPATILFAERMIAATSWREALQSLALLALVIGIQFTGGHIETAVNILLAFGAYYLIRWIQMHGFLRGLNWSKLARLFVLPAAAVSLGVAAGAVQMLPFLEWLPLSAEFHYRSPIAFRLMDMTFVRNIPSIVLAIYPNLFGNPTWSYPYQPFYLPSENYITTVLYIGIPSICLALIALVVGWKRSSMVGTWGLICLLSIGMALRLPLFDWINQLPVLNLANPTRLRLITAFGLCMLAGFGAEVLLGRHPVAREAAERWWLRLMAAVAVLGLLIATAGNLVLPLFTDRIVAYGRQLAEKEYAARATHTFPLEYYYAQVEQIARDIVAAFSFQNLSMYSPAIVALAGWILVRWSRDHAPARRRLPWALVGLLALDLLYFGYGFNPTSASTDFYPRTALASAMASDPSPFRMIALRQALIPDTHVAYRISDVRGLDFPTYWYARYARLVPERIPWLTYGEIFSAVDSPLLRVLNLKYVVAGPPDNLNGLRGASPVATDGEASLAQLAEVQPRSFMVYEAVVASDDEVAARLLADGGDLVRRRAILAGGDGAPVRSISTPPPNGAIPQHDVSLVRYQPSETIWKVSTSEDGYLVNTDSFYPGWNAYLDGQPAALIRANIAFRAVYVPRGDHTLTFRFEPWSVFAGALVTIAATFALLIFAVGLSRGRDSRSGQASV